MIERTWWIVVVCCLALACSDGDDDDDVGDDDDDDSAVDAGPDLDAAPDAAPTVCLGRAEGPTASKACGCVDDCDIDETCVREEDYGIPGGSCLRACRDDEECPDGTACRPGVGCLQTCEATPDCRPGYVCTRPMNEGALVCVGQCQRDEDCPATGSCDRYTGVCGDLGSHPGDGEIGAACDSDADCISAFCGQGAAFPGGYCSAFCSVSLQGCPGGGPCFANAGDDDDMGHCLAHCEDDTDCREDEGYLCGYSADLPDSWFCGTS